MALNLDDRLDKMIKKAEKVKKNPVIEDEETYLYDEKRPSEFINESQNGVFDIKNQSGINTSKSVFDKSLVFKTNE